MKPRAVLLALLLSVPGLASAEPPDAGSDPARGQWEFSLAPYLWGSSLDGTATARGVTSDFEASFSDILQNLDLALLAAAEARNGRLSIISNLVWMKLSADASKAVGPPIIGAVLKVDVEAQMAMVDGLVGYEILSRSLGAGSDGNRVAVDLRGGLRAWYFDTDIDVSLAGSRLSFSESSDWVDLVGGARVRMDLADRLRLTVSGDIGGFDLGSSSDFTWSLTGLLAYQMSPSWQLVGGWRELDVDRKNIDFRLSGPLLGAVHHF